MSNNQTIERGRHIQIHCLGGEFPIILSVTATVTHAGAPGAENIIYSGVASFPYNDSGNLRACHSQPGTAFYLLDRSRFHVAMQGTDPWPTTPTRTSTR
jgi:hypothetical protein